MFLGDTIAENLLCLTDADRSQYDIQTVSKKWNDSFKTRQETLIQVVKKKIVIRTQTYLNTFICLKQPLGLSLVIGLFYEIDSSLLYLVLFFMATFFFN